MMDKRLIAVLAAVGIAVAGLVAKRTIAKRRCNSEACVQEEFAWWLRKTGDPVVEEILKGYHALTDNFDYPELLDVVSSEDLTKLAGRFAEETRDSDQRPQLMLQLTGRL